MSSAASDKSSDDGELIDEKFDIEEAVTVETQQPVAQVDKQGMIKLLKRPQVSPVHSDCSMIVTVVNCCLLQVGQSES